MKLLIDFMNAITHIINAITNFYKVISKHK